jgi:erythromycin esterase-like protein
VHVLHGDGTKGWPEHAPYDGIIVAAGGPKIPESLKEQLKIGGRLVSPVGRDPKIQELVRVTRISEKEYRREDLADVRFVPLIGHEGWTPAVAIEGDCPDAARVDHYVRHLEYPPSEWTAFARFPVWMWRNNEVRAFIDWLRHHNAPLNGASRVAFHGLDLYSLYDSIRAVLKYLDQVDPHSAHVARERYGCLTPWQSDPATYGHAALTGAYPTCESDVVRVLTDLLHKRRDYAERDGERFMDAVQNARLITNAERYYRIMYYGSRASWNLRDSHMFETLKTLLAFYGPRSEAIVWAHNSHIGNAAATEMFSRGEYNLGHLCRKEFGDLAYAIGFGTHTGTVAAASNWDGPMDQDGLAGNPRQLRARLS